MPKKFILGIVFNQHNTLQVKSRTVVEAFIQCIEAVNKDLNAVVAKRYEEALKTADEVDAALDSGSVPAEWSPDNAPFLGVPFTTKEAMAIVG